MCGEGRASLPIGQSRPHGLLERAIDRQARRTGNGFGRLFSGAAFGPLSIAKQNSRPFAVLRFASALRFAAGAGPARLPLFVAMKAAAGAVDPTKRKRNDLPP